MEGARCAAHGEEARKEKRGELDSPTVGAQQGREESRGRGPHSMIKYTAHIPCCVSISAAASVSSTRDSGVRIVHHGLEHTFDLRRG
jgi:hypothetical protein